MARWAMIGLTSSIRRISCNCQAQFTEIDSYRVRSMDGNYPVSRRFKADRRCNQIRAARLTPGSCPGYRTRAFWALIRRSCDLSSHVIHGRRSISILHVSLRRPRSIRMDRPCSRQSKDQPFLTPILESTRTLQCEISRTFSFG